ncbi:MULTISPECIES: RMD1 family protein [Phenylobacterium]|uniref:Rmd1/YagE family protein n=1 Tax=Phenylobacterium koreense TaxID=266125 RepID=A0ABV2EE09_9CAUL
MSARPQRLPEQIAARAVLLGERIDTAGLEREDAISSTPIAFRHGEGLVVVFRYGVVVMVGLEALAEDEVLRSLAPRVRDPVAVREEETLLLSTSEEAAGRPEGGAIRIGTPSADKLLVAADAVAKSAALASDERQVAEVFDTIEPWARRLAETGKSPSGRRSVARMIGSALLVQHRVAARVAVREKPDILWDRPDLERLYARLEDEFELVERAETLGRKVDLISETVTAMSDMIDTERSLRLEVIIVVLILVEVLMVLIQTALGMPH